MCIRDRYIQDGGKTLQKDDALIWLGHLIILRSCITVVDGRNTKETSRNRFLQQVAAVTNLKRYRNFEQKTVNRTTSVLCEVALLHFTATHNSRIEGWGHPCLMMRTAHLFRCLGPSFFPEIPSRHVLFPHEDSLPAFCPR